jgi:hypothetical protein
MQPIDRPFRPAWDFFVVWVFLAAVMFFVTRRSELAELPVAYYAELILVPFFATFILYGPVLLARQIIRSGSRGWFVARVFLSIILALGAFCFILYFTGHADDRSQMWSGVAISIALAYLHWRLRDETHA